MYYKPHSMRLKDYEELRKKSPHRIAAAVRAIRRIEDKNYQPLFDGPKMSHDQVLEKAHERLEKYIKWGREQLIENRKYIAQKWLLVRRVRRRVPDVVRMEFDRKWKSETYPGGHEYALTILNGLIRAYYFEEKPFNNDG